MLSSLTRCVAKLLLPGLTLCAISPVPAQDNLLPVFHFNHLSTADGLSSNAMRSRVVRDGNGFVWFGTANGLDRYDGYGVKGYRNIPDDPHTLSSNAIWSLLVDRKNRLWVGTFETGLSLYDAARDRFTNFLPRPGDSLWLQTKGVLALMEDHAGTLWLGLEYGGVARLEIPDDAGFSDRDSLAARAHFRTYSLGTPRNSARDLFERDDGEILIASDSGLIVLDPGSGISSRQHLADPLGRRLDTVSLHCITRDHAGNFWVGSGTQGAFRFAPGSGRVTNVRHESNDSLSLSSDWVMDIAEDRFGNVWIATLTGLHQYSPRTGSLAPYVIFGRAPHLSLGNQLSFDRTGTLWVSTGEDGVYWLSPKSRRFPHYAMSNTDGSPTPVETVERSRDGTFWFSSLGKLFQIDITTLRVLKTIDVFRGKTQSFWQPDNSVTFLDDRGDLWYGTWGLGLYRITLAGGLVKNYGYTSSTGEGSVVMSIAQGPGHSIWTSAYRDGMMTFDPASGRFQNLPVAKLAFPFHVMRGHDGRMWIASERGGVFLYDPVTGKTDQFVHDPSNQRSLSQDRTRKTYQDASGRVWIDAGRALNLWDPGTRSFTHYVNSAFPQSLYAEPLGSDRKGRLWISYGGRGLSVLDPSSGTFTNFDASDGVCGYVIDMVALEDGRVLLTGSSGLNMFYPDSIELSRPPPPLGMVRMAINDESVAPPPLHNGSGSIQLSHAQDVLEFEFAAIDIDAPGLVQYRYMLEGHEKGWVKPKDHRYVRYTTLPPGDYVFRVRAASSWGEWPEQEIALAVSISPPWWRTTWAYGAYVFLFVGLLTAGYRMRLRQVQLKQAAKMEHFQAVHLAEVDRLKSRFFANISHEFRTPLTLILGPIQKWRAETARRDVSPHEMNNDLSMAERNAQRLLTLINQLLDLSRLEAGAMKLRARRMNIVPLVKGIACSFASSAGMKGVALNVQVDEDEIEIYCDKDKVEKILANLLSNAFKFTPAGGGVTVTVTQFRIQNSELRDQESNPPLLRNGGVAVSIADTGIGIPPEQLDKVFDRFYQVDASQIREHEGSGIGLALAKELVDVHHGTIQVHSEVGKGTTFTVELPLGRAHLMDGEIVAAEEDVPHEVATSPEGAIPVEDPAGRGESPLGGDAREIDKVNSLPLILIIEDNADVRAYLKGYLVPAYQVREAGDGAEGIEMAQEIIPDLIISDVMMPKKDGYEVCQALKWDEKTSHIPIILLTAKAASENRIEGLETGADDYLVKPFEPRELLARVRNLIDLRRKLRERFSATVPLKPGEIAVSSIDDVFLRKVSAVVEQRMSDENLSVEELGREVGMSRSQLHRKLTALTNQSPSDFIRYMRLHRAMALLQGNAGTVAEVAYTVGFGDPSHFSRRFHELFGITPGDVRRAPR